jgi:UDP-N-acetylmuramate--alanine ligase
MTKLFKEPRRIHFVGIGGVGMSGIAEVLLTLGHRVSGSDLGESDATRRLIARGATISYGHRAEAVDPRVDVVVISSAVKYSNPEVVQARALKIPVIPRAEMLAELMRLKHGIAVAGTHGKTTTTSLIAAILAKAGMDPTMVIGGKVHAMGTNARLGQGELLVAEADESDGTFLMLSPVIAVVTNIDPEHLDYYGDMDRVRSAYLEFMNRVPFYGVSVLCLDSVNVRSLLPQVRKRVITYGTTDDCEYVARDLCVIGMETLCEVVRAARCSARCACACPGRHHALNALAAIAVPSSSACRSRRAARRSASSAASTAASSCAARRAASW